MLPIKRIDIYFFIMAIFFLGSLWFCLRTYSMVAIAFLMLSSIILILVAEVGRRQSIRDAVG